MLVRILRVLLGLGRVLLALGMVVLAMMFRSLVVFVFHFGFLILAEKFRQFTRTAPLVAE
jgi:hypothetical protein